MAPMASWVWVGTGEEAATALADRTRLAQCAFL